MYPVDSISYIFCLSTEAIAPLIVGTQNQFNFTHITAGSTAMGKVVDFCNSHLNYIL